MPISIFDYTVSFLSKALDMTSERHKLLASNIANQDTPNYKAKDINFTEELTAALGTNGPEDIYRTNSRHMGKVGSAHPTGDGVQVRIVTRPDTGSGYDNNGVNVEIEMADMAKNTILYNASAQVISTKFKMLSHAIREGR